MKAVLYKASLYNCEDDLVFVPQPYKEVLFILAFLSNEADEDERGREARVMGLLNGDTIFTNLAAYKLVRE